MEYSDAFAETLIRTRIRYFILLPFVMTRFMRRYVYNYTRGVYRLQQEICVALKICIMRIKVSYGVEC